MSVERLVVHDANLDALDRRLGAAQRAFPEATVIATPSTTAVLVLAQEMPAGTPFLVDLGVNDRRALDRPGERLIERLASAPTTAHVRPIAWSAHVGADIVAGARAAHASAFVTATLDRAAEADGLRSACLGAPVWPTTPALPDSWPEAFRHHYGAAWEPWMEPVLTRLATTGERRSIAADLVARGAARSAPHAASRMREVARLIAGEHSASPAIVAERAVAALARLAMHAPLTERPAVTLSLSLAASALRAAPSLAIAAGLSGLEVDDLLALDGLIREQPEAERSVGAPPSDRARAERRWAAGRRAVACGAVRDDIDPMITAILRRVDRALVALDDAQIDAERHPAPRAAAALTAVVQTGGGLPDAVGTAAGAATWRGRTPAELALDDELSSDDLRAFVRAADRWLAARAPSPV